MANRVIREGINDSKRINDLGFEAEVFYRRLFAVADDFGYFEADVDLLRSDLYKRLVEKISLPQVQDWMNKCFEVGLIDLYMVEGKKYGQILRFNQSLRIMRSKFPNKHGKFISRSEYLDQQNHLKADENIRMHLPLEKKGNQSEEKMNRQTLTDVFLKDLPNSYELEKTSMNIRVPKQDLLKWVKPFKQTAMRLEYRNFVEFVEHFKNWYLKQDKSKLSGSKGPKKLGE